MHFLVGTAVLVGLVAFAFGERVARIFVGGLLGVGALFVLLIAYVAVVDIHRQSTEQSRPQVVHMERSR